MKSIYKLRNFRINKTLLVSILFFSVLFNSSVSHSQVVDNQCRDEAKLYYDCLTKNLPPEVLSEYAEEVEFYYKKTLQSPESCISALLELKRIGDSLNEEHQGKCWNISIGNRKPEEKNMDEHKGPDSLNLCINALEKILDCMQTQSMDMVTNPQARSMIAKQIGGANAPILAAARQSLNNCENLLRAYPQSLADAARIPKNKCYVSNYRYTTASPYPDR